ncbi:hypothetical protein [Nocardia jiangsuensis]|uniref:Uncharacterized protein n=1 Tax=Nocardia jiangsuensis TaxID=1691563 RepID=A0ABV8DPN3_9NOCA
MMFERCHTTSEVAGIYRRIGFTTVSCMSDRVSLIAAPSLGAVAMPPTVGARVRDQLVSQHRCKSTPILTHRGPDRSWVFLVGPAWGRTMTPATMNTLATQGLRVLVAGQRIWLPMTDHPIGWRWLSPPIDVASLPARTTVIAAARQHLGPLPRSASR